uniref:Uncharacterized protein n=1 Tax=Anopheles melas TaxID=34690 RepID=A0A182UFF0_9DIPT
MLPSASEPVVRVAPYGHECPLVLEMKGSTTVKAGALSSLRSRKDEQRAVTAELPIPGRSKTKREGGKKEQQKAELKVRRKNRYPLVTIAGSGSGSSSGSRKRKRNGATTET